ncbi:unnamed protein product [Amoebophrya sp. A120]|nr:unnamed protein product [Amoebophrya sp. A120]|eukprot:GSA120T00004195001.1
MTYSDIVPGGAVGASTTRFEHAPPPMPGAAFPANNHDFFPAGFSLVSPALRSLPSLQLSSSEDECVYFKPGQSAGAQQFPLAEQFPSAFPCSVPRSKASQHGGASTDPLMRGGRDPLSRASTRDVGTSTNPSTFTLSKEGSKEDLDGCLSIFENVPKQSGEQRSLLAAGAVDAELYAKEGTTGAMDTLNDAVVADSDTFDADEVPLSVQQLLWQKSGHLEDSRQLKVPKSCEEMHETGYLYTGGKVARLTPADCRRLASTVQGGQGRRVSGDLLNMHVQGTYRDAIKPISTTARQQEQEELHGQHDGNGVWQGARLSPGESVFVQVFEKLEGTYNGVLDALDAEEPFDVGKHLSDRDLERMGENIRTAVSTDVGWRQEGDLEEGLDNGDMRQSLFLPHHSASSSSPTARRGSSYRNFLAETSILEQIEESVSAKVLDEKQEAGTLFPDSEEALLFTGKWEKVTENTGADSDEQDERHLHRPGSTSSLRPLSTASPVLEILGHEISHHGSVTYSYDLQDPDFLLSHDQHAALAATARAEEQASRFLQSTSTTADSNLPGADALRPRDGGTANIPLSLQFNFLPPVSPRPPAESATSTVGASSWSTPLMLQPGHHASTPRNASSGGGSRSHKTKFSSWRAVKKRQITKRHTDLLRKTPHGVRRDRLASQTSGPTTPAFGTSGGSVAQEEAQCFVVDEQDEGSRQLLNEPILQQILQFQPGTFSLSSPIDQYFEENVILDSRPEYQLHPAGLRLIMWQRSPSARRGGTALVMSMRLLRAVAEGGGGAGSPAQRWAESDWNYMIRTRERQAHPVLSGAQSTAHFPGSPPSEITSTTLYRRLTPRLKFLPSPDERRRRKTRSLLLDGTQERGQQQAAELSYFQLNELLSVYELSGVWQRVVPGSSLSAEEQRAKDNGAPRREEQNRRNNRFSSGSFRIFGTRIVPLNRESEVQIVGDAGRGAANTRRSSFAAVGQAKAVDKLRGEACAPRSSSSSTGGAVLQFFPVLSDSALSQAPAQRRNRPAAAEPRTRYEIYLTASEDQIDRGLEGESGDVHLGEERHTIRVPIWYSPMTPTFMFVGGTLFMRETPTLMLA